MPNYPESIYEPREKENKPGVVYKPEKTTTGFVEDITQLDEEVVAIETELGTNPKGIFASVKDNLIALWEAIAGFVTSFLELSDTPASYEGQTGKVVAVNEAEDGLEFIPAGAGEAPVPESRPEKLGSPNTLMLPGVEGITTGTGTRSADTIYYEPIYINYACNIKKIVFEVTSAGAAGSKARVALYAADMNWQPTTLLVSSGEIAIDSTGRKTTDINVPVNPGRYLLAYHPNASAGLRIVRGGNRYVGYNTTLGANTFIVALTLDTAYAAFSDPGTAWYGDPIGNVPFWHTLFIQLD